MSFLKDDRTKETAKTHTVIIGGKDRFLSHWRCNDGRASYAFWACLPEDAETIQAWIDGRSDIVRAKRRNIHRIRELAKNNDVHVYVVSDNHPSLAK